MPCAPICTSKPPRTPGLGQWPRSAPPRSFGHILRARYVLGPPDRCAVPPSSGKVVSERNGGGEMLTKIKSVKWRHLLYSGATMAMLLMAAGARWKPKN